MHKFIVFLGAACAALLFMATGLSAAEIVNIKQTGVGTAKVYIAADVPDGSRIFLAGHGLAANVPLDEVPQGVVADGVAAIPIAAKPLRYRSIAHNPDATIGNTYGTGFATRIFVDIDGVLSDTDQVLYLTVKGDKGIFAVATKAEQALYQRRVL